MEVAPSSMPSNLLRPSFRKHAKRRGQAYPVATIALYGPTESRATKVAVGVVRAEGAEAEMKRWFAEAGDIRHDTTVEREVAQHIAESGVTEVIMTDRVIGCPHEEGIDYPEGEVCQECPFWAHRDRWSGKVIS